MVETNENKTFDFATAVKYLQEGKKVRPTTAYAGFFYYLSSDEMLCDHTNSLFSHFSSSCFIDLWELYNV